MKQKLVLLMLPLVLSGCITSKSVDGTVTKKLDPEAVAAVQAAVHQAILDSAEIQQIIQASEKK